MICHLADSFRVTIGEKTGRPRAYPRPDSCAGLVREMDCPGSPAGLAPGLRPGPRSTKERWGTPPKDFEADLGDLRRSVGSLYRAARDFEWQPHPIFGGWERVTDAMGLPPHGSHCGSRGKR